MVLKKNKELININHSYINKYISENYDNKRFEIIYNSQDTIINIIDKKNNIFVHEDLPIESKILSDYDFNKTHLFAFLALDTGYYAKIVLTKYPYKHFVIIEKDKEYFNFLINNIDLSFIFKKKNIHILINPSPDEISIYIERYFGLLMYHNIRFIESKSRISLHKSYYDSVKKNMNILVSTSYTNYHTIKKFSNEWEKNIIYNIEKYILYQDINCLKNIFKNTPCILIGAGPSLDKNLNYLQQIQKKLVLVAVDTAVRTLINNNIIPDIVVSIDSQIINYTYIKGLKFEKTFLFAPPLILPEVFNLFDSNVFVFNYGHSLLNYIDKAIGKYGKTSVIGNVSSCAIDICRQLGCSEIYLIGCDFGFKGTESHTKAAVNDILTFVFLNKFITYETYLLSKNQNTFQAEGYTGYVNTNNDLLKWKNWFEDYIYKSGLKVINCSDDGLIIKNTQFEYLSNINKKLNMRNKNVYQILKSKSDIIDIEKKLNIKRKVLESILNNLAYYKKKIEIIDKQIKKYHDKKDYYYYRFYNLIQEIIFGSEINKINVFDVKKMLIENNYNITEKTITDFKNFFDDKLNKFEEVI